MSMIYDMHFLKKENVQNFINKYGKITDKEIAKRLLCITSNAWLMLDDSLKSDSEIIMYYQPMAEIGYTIYQDVGCIEPIASATGYQKGFKRNEEMSSKGYSYNIYACRFPEIDYPEDFNYELYADVQSELFKESKIHTIEYQYIPTEMLDSMDKKIIERYNEVLRGNEVDSETEQLIKNIEYDLDEINKISDTDYSEYFDGPGVYRCDDKKYIVYDRNRLKNIIESTLKKKAKQKKIQLKTNY